MGSIRSTSALTNHVGLCPRLSLSGDMSDGRLNGRMPAIAQYREMLVQGATHVSFRQHFARALYVQSLAQPDGVAGNAKRRDSLDQAVRLLNGLSEEARQLHDTKELLSWIVAEQKKLNTGAAPP